MLMVGLLVLSSLYVVVLLNEILLTTTYNTGNCQPEGIYTHAIRIAYVRT